MTFVRTLSGTEVRVEAVHRVRRESGLFGRVTLCLENGAEYEADCDAWLEARRTNTVRFVPANPGTFVLSHSVEDGNLRVLRDTIIAWAIYDIGCDPVTFSGVLKTHDHLSDILQPDGSVRNESEYFGSYENWYQNALAQHAKSARLNSNGVH